MKKLLIAAFSFLLFAGSATAQGNGKKMGHHKGYAWQTDPNGRMWRLDRGGNKIWRDDKQVKRDVNRGGHLNNGNNGDHHNGRGRGDGNNR